MIHITCGVSQDFIIELLEKEPIEGITFKYEGKKGITLNFSVDTDDLDKAITVAKATIKATQIGSVLFFQISK